MPLLTLLLLACPGGGKDLDVDGLVGRRDRCPEEPETLNGWMDEDGCPDRLARLKVEVEGERDGEPVPEAEVSLPGASPRLTDKNGVAIFFDLLPVKQGVFVHVRQGSAAVDVKVELVEGERVVRVVLPE